MNYPTKTIDIHGMTADEARKRLHKEVGSAPQDLDHIIVIHGCNNGTVLRDTVRRFSHTRILRISPSFLNDGETKIYLRKTIQR